MAPLLTIDWPAKTREYAIKWGIDPERFYRQIRLESANFDPRVISGERKGGSGEIGIAQMMPATARGWGVNPYDPFASLDVAAREMKRMTQRYGGAFGGWLKAIIGYNAGEGYLASWGGNPDSLPDHTKRYLEIVLGSGWRSGTGDGDSGGGGGGSLPGLTDLPALIGNLPGQIGAALFDPDKIAAAIWQTFDNLRQRIRDALVKSGKEVAARFGVPVVFGILGVNLIVFGLLGLAISGALAVLRSKPGRAGMTVAGQLGPAPVKAGVAAAGMVI